MMNSGLLVSLLSVANCINASLLLLVIAHRTKSDTERAAVSIIPWAMYVLAISICFACCLFILFPFSV
jgi:peptidoglycan biosynthesis protein MviN/MurJ (putative lipid II flippase)